MYFGFSTAPHSNQWLQLMVTLGVRDIEQLGKHWPIELAETCPSSTGYHAKAFDGNLTFDISTWTADLTSQPLCKMSLHYL